MAGICESGESSSIPPFRSSLGVGSASVSASNNGGHSGNVSTGSRVRASRLDSYILPRTTGFPTFTSEHGLEQR